MPLSINLLSANGKIIKEIHMLRSATFVFHLGIGGDLIDYSKCGQINKQTNNT